MAREMVRLSTAVAVGQSQLAKALRRHKKPAADSSSEDEAVSRDWTLIGLLKAYEMEI